MKWLCKIIGHKWRPSRLADALFAGMLSPIFGVKFTGFSCARCGEIGLA